MALILWKTAMGQLLTTT